MKSTPVLSVLVFYKLLTVIFLSKYDSMWPKISERPLKLKLCIQPYFDITDICIEQMDQHLKDGTQEWFDSCVPVPEYEPL